MTQANKGMPTKKPGMKIGLVHIIIAIIAILIIYFVVSSVFLNQVHQLGAQESFTINKNSTIFYSFPDNSTTYAIFLKNSSTSSATFYISGLPVFTKPIVAITLSGGGSANISSKAGSVADIHITLFSSTNSQATFSLTPLLQGLDVKVSGNVNVINPSTGASSVPISGNATASTTTSTIPSSSTSTTTIAVNANQKVLSGLNSTPIGTLMAEYKALYIKDVQCTPSVYNSTFLSQFGYLPPAPASYQNTTLTTPTNINLNVSKFSANVYNVTYSTVSPSPETTGTALIVQYNLVSNSVISQKFEGLVFFNQTYAKLDTTYAFQSGINNDCGAYIP